MNNCYNVSEEIIGSQYVGELAGKSNSSTGANFCYFNVTTAVAGGSGNTWSNHKAYTLEQMKTKESGLLTLLNTGDGVGLWAQSADKNDGLPYLINNMP